MEHKEASGILCTCGKKLEYLGIANRCHQFSCTECDKIYMIPATTNPDTLPDTLDKCIEELGNIVIVPNSSIIENHYEISGRVNRLDRNK
jgi:hypothetical protein